MKRMPAARPLSANPVTVRIATFAVFTALSAMAGSVEGAPGNKKSAAVAELPVSTGGTLGYARGRLLVAPRAGLSDAEFGKALKALNAKSRGRFARTGTHVVDLPAGIDELQALQQFRKDKRFKYVELDMAVAPALVPTDPAYANSWALHKIQAPAAWDKANGSGVVIAVLDTGVDATHPDLAANLLPGRNIYDNNTDTSDVHGHGTSVSGAAAAVANNGTGSVGVAWGAKILPVRISAPDGYAYYSTIAQGLTWAADNGARVANVSYGASGSASVQSAANYLRGKGGVVVVSAGNNGVEETIAANDAVLTISATNSSDVRPSWSSYGAFVDLAAPGVSIYAPTRGGGYANVSGTSFSAPITAGLVALMFSTNPRLAPADIDRILKTTAVDLGTTGFDKYYGYGRIDAARAVTQAASTQAQTDTQAPTVRILSPLGGTVEGVVPVDMEYTDNVGVTRVELYLGQVRVASDDVSPFAFAWDSTQSPDGAYNLSVRAYDAAGNAGVSTPVAIQVRNDTQAPVISSFNLTDGMTISPTSQSVTASASDNQRVTRMTLSIGGKEVAMSNGASISYTWNTRKLAGGSYTVSVRAWDAAGNSAGRSATVFKAGSTSSGATEKPGKRSQK